MKATLKASLVFAVAVTGASCGPEKRADLRIDRSEADERNLIPAVVGAIIDRLEEDGSNEDELLAAATPGQRTIFLVSITDGEVSNGGFAQFFSNHTGRHTAQAIESAQMLGAAKHEQILREAAAVFPNGHVPTDYEERNRVYDLLPDTVDRLWSRLDERWYGLNGELEQLGRMYIEAHPDEFFR